MTEIQELSNLLSEIAAMAVSGSSPGITLARIIVRLEEEGFYS